MTDEMKPPARAPLPDFRTKADVVYQHLREQILEGRLTPGEKITLAALAAEFRTSQMPVREAVRRLDHEGLIEITPHTGMSVASLSTKETLEIFAIRPVLEGLAAAMAAESGDAALADRLDAINEEIAAAIARADFGHIADANWRFHQEILAAAANDYLARLLTELWTRSFRFRIGFKLIPGRAQKAYGEHAAIAAAIRRRDAREAEAAARRHIEQAGSDLKRMMQKENWQSV
jgi:DNA-binding GntR family transcriptional regulator